jgi:hypothetical protein
MMIGQAEDLEKAEDHRDIFCYETAKCLETDLIGWQKTIETDFELDGGTTEELETDLVERPKIRDRFEF